MTTDNLKACLPELPEPSGHIEGRYEGDWDEAWREGKVRKYGKQCYLLGLNTRPPIVQPEPAEQSGLPVVARIEVEECGKQTSDKQTSVKAVVSAFGFLLPAGIHNLVTAATATAEIARRDAEIALVREQMHADRKPYLDLKDKLEAAEKVRDDLLKITEHADLHQIIVDTAGRFVEHAKCSCVGTEQCWRCCLKYWIDQMPDGAMLAEGKNATNQTDGND